MQGPRVLGAQHFAFLREGLFLDQLMLHGVTSLMAIKAMSEVATALRQCPSARGLVGKSGLPQTAAHRRGVVELIHAIMSVSADAALTQADY